MLLGTKATRVLHDDKLSATFADTAADFGQLTEMKIPGADSIEVSPGPVWHASFVGAGVTGKSTVSSSTVDCARKDVPSFSETQLSLKWIDCHVPFAPATTDNLSSRKASFSLVNVSLDISLSDGLLEYLISFDSNGAISLWDYTISLSYLKTTNSMQPVQTKAASQLLGFYDTASDVGNAVYFAAHDPAQTVKTCSASKSAQGGQLSCMVLSPTATLPLKNYKAPFPIAVTLISGDWWDLASLYRAWVIQHAHWARVGPLDTRKDLPVWLENITLWMNNNWGSDPLTPNYGGDPAYVQNMMLKVNSLLNLPAHGAHLALHWYEWDTLGYELGSNHTKCDRTNAPCGFDTHYPDYFPARVGCKDSIKAMQHAGMRVVPYINGQLFDTLIPRWKADSAMSAVQKYVEETMQTKSHSPTLTPHLEKFDNITSAVMCPAAKYWHNVMRDTIVRLVNDLGFDGVYVDQVGNGEKRNCADPTHNHTINGGSFWAEAFYSIMAEVRSKVPSSMFMTEGIAEEVSGAAFDILLGLQWNELPFWSAIYGGFGYATGHAGSIKAPLSGNPRGGDLVAQLTQQFMVGGTMGWFTYQNYQEDFFKAENADKIDYIRRLSDARIVAKKWMVHGRAARTLTLKDSSGTMKRGCFLREKVEETASVVCAIAQPSNTTSATYSFAIHPSRLGLAVPDGAKVHLTDLRTGKALGDFVGTISYSSALSAYDVHLLKLSVSDEVQNILI